LRFGPAIVIVIVVIPVGLLLDPLVIAVHWTDVDGRVNAVVDRYPSYCVAPTVDVTWAGVGGSRCAGW
jgi:hypothetical protein